MGCLVLWLSAVLATATLRTPQPARLRRLRSVVISWWADTHPVERSFQGGLTVANRIHIRTFSNQQFHDFRATAT
jgi:hypothetical protein